MKKILVLGGGGFIGRNVVSELLKDSNNYVISADISHKNVSISNRKNLRIISKDFTEYNSFELLDVDIDEVYMLAALVGVNKTLRYPDEIILVNTLLTMNCIRWMKSISISKLLFASSSENYAGTYESFGGEIPTSESVPLCISDIKHPRFTYAITKIHGESAFFHFAKSNGLKCVIVRYQNIIGPNMGFRHAIPHIVQRFIESPFGPIKIYGGEQTRSFSYISDAVQGTISAMNSNKTDGEIYHIGNNDEITISTLTKEIGSILNYKGKYLYAECYPGSVDRRCPNINKAKKDFNFNPKVNWKESISKTVYWYRDYFEKGGEPIDGGFLEPEKTIIK